MYILPYMWPHWLQHARPPCPSPRPRVYPNSCPLSWWCHPTISSFVILSPAFNLSQHQGLFKWVSSSHEVAKVLKFQVSISPYNESVQFSRSVVSDSLWAHGLQHARLPFHHQLPELAQTHIHRVSDTIHPSHPLSSPSSSCLQSFPASGSFPMNQFFASGGHAGFQRQHPSFQ